MKVSLLLYAGTAAVLNASVQRALAEPPNLGPVTSAPVAEISQGYGRAGGLTGPQRVQALQRPDGPAVNTGVQLQQHVLATWSEEVAKRTHMPLAASMPGAGKHAFRAPRKPKY